MIVMLNLHLVAEKRAFHMEHSSFLNFLENLENRFSIITAFQVITETSEVVAF